MKKYWFLILIILCLFLFCKYRTESDKNINSADIGQQNLEKIVIKNGSLKHFQKNASNETETKKYILPKESQVIITQKVNKNIFVEVKNKGLIFTPALAMFVLNKEAVPALYIRTIYYADLALGPSITFNKNIGIAFEKRFVESAMFNNTSILLFISKTSAGLGIALSF